jgi:hypothetical protein
MYADRGMLAVLVGGALLIAGCSGLAVRSGGPDSLIPSPDDGISGRPGTEGAGGPVTSTLPDGASRKTVCRAAPVPRGWVAVDYVEASGMCGSAAGPYSAVVLQQLAPLPEGTILTVCAGQSIPANWRREPDDGAPVATGQCPRNPSDRRTGPTTMQIRRAS